jgi:hypothetical protein
MTQKEKRLYVAGFINGRVLEAHDLCQKLDDAQSSSSVVPAHPLSDPGETPCLSFRFTYNRFHAIPTDLIGFAPYVKVVDDFYSHEECRSMPYDAILEHLDDSEFRGGEDLYQFVRSGHAEWGAFTVPGGMGKCYGADGRR